MLTVAGLTALVFSIIEAPDAGWGTARTLGGIGGGLALLVLFAAWELRLQHPMLDPRHFRNRHLSAGSLSIFIQFFAFFGFTFVALQYLQGVRGYSPLIAALSVLPLAAAMMPTARIIPKLAARFGAGTSASRGSSSSRLVLTPNTVRNHVSNVLAKLNAGDRSQAIVIAHRSGPGARTSAGSGNTAVRGHAGQ